jgi:CheY-like chemotaxis protein
VETKQTETDQIRATARILVIDDDRETRSVLQDTLEQAGYNVTGASSGVEGLSKLRTVPADLVPVDIFLPDQDGLTTMTHVRREFPEIRIIAMSGHATGGTMLMIAKHFGASGILRKPFSQDELLPTIEKALWG